MTPRLQPLTRAKVAALGEAGRVWQHDLPAVLAELADRWELTLGRALPGGSASYVCEAETALGEPRVVKVVVPDPDLADESLVLGAAGGCGYALLHAHEPARRALLIERLGPSLEATPMAPERVLDLLADTLLEAWRLPVDAVPPAAADRATVLLDALLARASFGGSGAVLDEARACAERLTAADDPRDHVVVHGDPHPPNLLRVLVDRPGAASGWVFVDPDGFRCDPAYDVGVTLRDWTARLEGGEARATLLAYTHRMAERTGLDVERVWDWAYLERVSTGLYLLSLGADRLGRRFVDSAAALLR